ncbi:MAG TPA: complex I subunit 5 family protein [Erythrobacter sp.]|nr:complex I subunit 5 family protein [Erythrobacter sp.]
MIGHSGPLLPLVSLVWPLLLGLLASLPAIRPHALRLLPLASLPALWLALTGVQGLTLAPELLLGVRLGAERPAALLLGLTAALWFAAAIHAQGSMAGTRKPAVFSGFWCLTLAGNLGVFLAQDVVTFYVAFAAVSLSSYFLVVHEATDAALRAGRVYAVLAIIGEVCLLVAFVIGVGAANGLMIDDIRAALPTAPLGGMATALLIAGFGIKAGLMPLHMWLPLAHPAAPTPASAVLSGAIVKAGIIGLMLFLPAMTGAATVLVPLGLGAAFVAALVGLRVRAPKAILAYSTISQMGLAIALIAAATRLPEGDMAPVAYYAIHHGLAKGALFLGVAVVAAAHGRWRAATLLVAGLVALSVAGAPLTGGGLAKAAAKTVLGPWESLALTLSAATTTLLLGWFWVRLAASPVKERSATASTGAAPSPLIWAPTAALALAALALPWWLWSEWSGLPGDYPWRLATLWSALWPVALGLAMIVVMVATRWPAGTQDEADPLRAARWIAAELGPLRTIPGKLATIRSEIADRMELSSRSGGTMLTNAAESVEHALLRWRMSGFIIIMFVLAVALSIDPGT